MRAIQIAMDDSNFSNSLTSSITDKNNRIVVKEGEERKITVFYSTDDPTDGVAFEANYSAKLNNNIRLNQRDSILAQSKKGRIAEITLNTTADIVSDYP